MVSIHFSALCFLDYFVSSVLNRLTFCLLDKLILDLERREAEAVLFPLTVDFDPHNDGFYNNLCFHLLFTCHRVCEGTMRCYYLSPYSKPLDMSF